MPSAKSKKAKTEYVSFAEIFPWARKENGKEYHERLKKRERAERAHPRAKSKAWGESARVITRMGNKGYTQIVGYIVKDPLYFIDSADLDAKQRKAYEKWLEGQTRPLIPGVEAASWSHDYDRFYNAFIEGRIATVND